MGRVEGQTGSEPLEKQKVLLGHPYCWWPILHVLLKPDSGVSAHPQMYTMLSHLSHNPCKIFRDTLIFDYPVGLIIGVFSNPSAFWVFVDTRSFKEPFWGFSMI